MIVMNDLTKKIFLKSLYISLGLSLIGPILFIIIIDNSFGFLKWIWVFLSYFILLPLSVGSIYHLIFIFFTKTYKDSPPNMEDIISELLEPNEIILWEMVRERYNGYRELYLLTNYRWIQKKNLDHLRKDLIGFLLDNNDFIKTNLNDINVVFTRNIHENDFYYIGFYYFYEEECKSNIPILGCSLNLNGYQELLKLLLENINLEKQNFNSTNNTLYFRNSSI